jgi:hypothetical protein
MDHGNAQNPPDWLVKSLAESEAQIEAGMRVPLEPFLDRLRASIARMESRQRRKPAKPSLGM